MSAGATRRTSAPTRTAPTTTSAPGAPAITLSGNAGGTSCATIPQGHHSRMPAVSLPVLTWRRSRSCLAAASSGS
eukprot:6232219-Alexandrium_andersonii.AAC.1